MHWGLKVLIMLPFALLIIMLLLWIFGLILEQVGDRWRVKWFIKKTRKYNFLNNLESKFFIKFFLLLILLISVILFGINEFKFLGTNRSHVKYPYLRTIFNQENKKELREKYFEYGIGGDFIISAIGALFLGMVAMVTYETLKKREEERNREEKLNNSAKCIERLTQSGLHDDALRISRDLFKDIFKEFNQQGKTFDVSNPICTAYLSNLEVYGECLLSHREDIMNELKNLIMVEKIYDELIQTLYQSTDWSSPKTNDGWEARTRRFAEEFLLSDRKNERYTAQSFLRHARFLNCWADVLIRLSRYVDRERYLDQAEIVLGWVWVGVFDLAFKSNVDATVYNCLDFILERIRYHRLRGDLIHEKNHINKHHEPDSYKKKLRDAECEYRRALSWIASLDNYPTGNIDFKGKLPLWIDYRSDNPDCDPLLCDWENISSTEADDKTSVNILRKSVKNCYWNDQSSYYLWSDIERCKCKENKIQQIRKLVRDTDIKPTIKPENNAEAARRTNLDDFTDDLITETADIYLRLAKNSIRYIAEANESEWKLPDSEYKCSDKLINRSLGHARALVGLELSWSHSVNWYDTLGVYLTEKGRYEERRNNTADVKELYQTASLVHEMTRLHLIDSSKKGVEIAHQADTADDSEWYNNVNDLLYLRNLIDLGRAQQHLYRWNHQDKQYSETDAIQKEFDIARRLLLQALKISTQTNNFICRAEAHLALAELYMVDDLHRSDAIIAFRSCIETFSRNEYPAYFDKVCTQLVNFYFSHHDKFNNIQKNIFIKSFNLCFDYADREKCPRFQNTTPDLKDHITDLLNNAPDECPWITNGLCHPQYWSQKSTKQQ